MRVDQQRESHSAVLVLSSMNDSTGDSGQPKRASRRTVAFQVTPAEWTALQRIATARNTTTARLAKNHVLNLINK